MVLVKPAPAQRVLPSVRQVAVLVPNGDEVWATLKLVPNPAKIQYKGQQINNVFKNI